MVDAIEKTRGMKSNCSDIRVLILGESALGSEYLLNTKYVST